jgi:hypothetical protein
VLRRDQSYRKRWIISVRRLNLPPGCLAWLTFLAFERSDDAAKPVWGNQARQGEQINRCERSVRTYRRLAEEAGVLVTDRCEPERGRDGRWCRRHTNVYKFVMPTRVKLPKEVLHKPSIGAFARTGRSDLPAGTCRSTFQIHNPGAELPAPPPPREVLPLPEFTEPTASPEETRRHLEAIRSNLRRIRVSP